MQDSAASVLRPYRRAHRGFLHLIFLVSGFAALLYQLAWQRALFALLGSDIASATIVVTAFLLGLGLGSLLGGILAKAMPSAAIGLFAIFELSLSLFGAFSLGLFAFMAEWFAAVSYPEAAMFSFLAVAFPTTLMGATLPLLVGYDVPRTGNVGQSVGGLYFANTLGAAIGALAAVTILFGTIGLEGTTLTAAALNLVLAIGALVLRRSSRGSL
jgi:predicted membrane-bound spermidine synthase